jgi:membrane protein implicated in regulation of membrane protease activity
MSGGMYMEKAYTILFWVGVIYTLVTFIIGDLFGAIHIDSHIDMNVDSHGGLNGFSLFPLKPITIVSFITVFGGIGILGTTYKLNPISTFIVAAVLGIVISFLLYRFVLIPLYKAQNTSAVSQDRLIGMEAKVISPIFENGFGTISYIVNGSKYNAPAQHISKKSVSQGEDVMIYEIKDNVFYVQPLNDKN